MPLNELPLISGVNGVSGCRRPGKHSLYKVLSRLGRSLLVASLVVLVAGAVTGCGKKNGGPDGERHAGAGQGGGNGAGRKGPKQPPVPVAVEMAQVGEISSYYAATATLTAEKEAEVLARVTGVVLALGCEEGDLVSKGDVLLRIEGDEYPAR